MEIRLPLLSSNWNSALSCPLTGFVSLFEKVRGLEETSTFEAGQRKRGGFELRQGGRGRRSDGGWEVEERVEESDGACVSRDKFARHQ
jgi:hypothetical protein